MVIMVTEHNVKKTAKRIRSILHERGIEVRYCECLELAGRLLGFENWRQYLNRDLNEPLGPLDVNLSDRDFAVRDDFQMKVLAATGLGPVARELLDRANPTGSWARKLPAPVEAMTVGLP